MKVFTLLASLHVVHSQDAVAMLQGVTNTRSSAERIGLDVIAEEGEVNSDQQQVLDGATQNESLEVTENSDAVGFVGRAEFLDTEGLTLPYADVVAMAVDAAADAVKVDVDAAADANVDMDVSAAVDADASSDGGAVVNVATGSADKEVDVEGLADQRADNSEALVGQDASAEAASAKHLSMMAIGQTERWFGFESGSYQGGYAAGKADQAAGDGSYAEGYAAGIADQARSDSTLELVAQDDQAVADEEFAEKRYTAGWKDQAAADTVEEDIAKEIALAAGELFVPPIDEEPISSQVPAASLFEDFSGQLPSGAVVASPTAEEATKEAVLAEAEGANANAAIAEKFDEAAAASFAESPAAKDASEAEVATEAPAPAFEESSEQALAAVRVDLPAAEDANAKAFVAEKFEEATVSQILEKPILQDE